MVPYGGFWWRVLAYIIDWVVLTIASQIFGTVLGMGLMPLQGLGADTGASDNGLAVIGIAAAAAGGSLLLNWLYFAVMESSALQATLGKLAVGVVVADSDGQRISFLRATGRYFAKFLSIIVMGIGFLMVAFTERKQGLHDFVAGTLVYKTRDPRMVESPEGVFA